MTFLSHHSRCIFVSAHLRQHNALRSNKIVVAIANKIFRTFIVMLDFSDITILLISTEFMPIGF